MEKGNYTNLRRTILIRRALIIVILLAIVGCSVWVYKATSSNKPSNDQTKVQSDGNKQQANPTNVSNTSNGNANSANKNSQNSNTEKVKVRGLYLTGWTVSSDAKLQHFIDLAKTTEINSYVLDIKDDDGLVGYKSDIPEVNNVKGFTQKYDVDKVLKQFHDNGIHVIGRIVCFKDPILSKAKPALAIKNNSGGSWRDNNGLTWLNPYKKEAWEYIVNIAKEGIQKGFDEIQFDYVRFANDGDKRKMNFSGETKSKYEIIDEFLAYAKNELSGTIVSADVFGIICESPADSEGIGQNLECIGKDIDYLSPMAYPSHYALGQIVNGVTFKKPDLEPYGVIYNSIIKAKNRISNVQGYKANIRPYLQDFTATWIGKGNYQAYGANQVRQQIKAVYDCGYDEWILWNASNKYSESALNKKAG